MIRVDVGSFSAAAVALKKAGVNIQAAMTKALEAAGEELHREIRATFSFTCHTLADLAALDHPYARRHGSIQIHKDRPYIVHTQSGELLKALKTMLHTDGKRYSVWFDVSAAPHARYVVEGTKKMLERDALWETALDERVRKQMMRAMVRVMGKEMRTGAMMRFAPTTRVTRPTEV